MFNSKYINFLKGFNLPFTAKALTNGYNIKNPVKDTFNDYVAISSDWQQVGNHIKTAMDSYGKTKS